MINADKRIEERSCNCKNSKCMKLYCDCFSARVPCGKTCRCVGCQNTTFREPFQEKLGLEKKLPKEELIRMHKGCACRRSNCTKKYCDCFQSGILCRDTCKCVDCQNNQSLTNRKVIEQLRNKNSQQSVNQSSINLYSLYISQNSEHLHSIIAQTNPLGLQQNWLDECAKALYDQAMTGNTESIIDKFLQILMNLQNTIGQQISFKQDYSEEMDEQRDIEKERNISDDHKFVDGSAQLRGQNRESFNQISNMSDEREEQNESRLQKSSKKDGENDEKDSIQNKGNRAEDGKKDEKEANQQY